MKWLYHPKDFLRLKAAEKSTKEPLIGLNTQKQKFIFKCKKKKLRENLAICNKYDKQRDNMLLPKNLMHIDNKDSEEMLTRLTEVVISQYIQN